MNSSLGVYFGTKTINVTEVRGRKVLKNIAIPVEKIFSGGAIEEKIPEDIKIVSLLKEGLRANNIEAKEATIALSGKDLIIRTFEIPIVPMAQRSSAIGIELKKYIPFKIEELVSDFQFYLDAPNHRYLVLFAGILKENINKYSTVFRQLNIKILSVEYSAFSILRLIGQAIRKEKDIAGIVNINHQEAGADFTVVENKFPLFSRDIKLLLEKQDTLNDPAAISEKLKTELRISADYFKRKFPGRKINRFFFIGRPDYLADIQSLAQELDMPLQIVDVSRVVDKALCFDSGFLKSYCCALPYANTSPKLNILSVWQRSKEPADPAVWGKAETAEFLGSLASNIDLRAVIAGILLCAGIFGFTVFKKLPLKEKLETTILSKPAVNGIRPDAQEPELLEAENRRKENIAAMEAMLKKQTYATPALAAVANFIPDGMWLSNLSFSELNNENSGFVIEGNIYREDRVEEVALVNQFVSALQKEKYFSDNFKDIRVDSIVMEEVSGKNVTRFMITGRRDK